MNKNEIGQLNYRKDRLELDSYFTPPYATELLLENEAFNGSIHEPACGAGHISKVLEARGYKVISSDIREDSYGESRIDFLKEKVSGDNIITNPPYSLCEPFIEQALKLARRKVAMLFRLSFLESAKRFDMFQTTPVSRVWVLSKRLPHWDGKEFKGSATFAHCWIVWDKEHQGEPKLGWLL